MWPCGRVDRCTAHALCRKYVATVGAGKVTQCAPPTLISCMCKASSWS